MWCGFSGSVVIWCGGFGGCDGGFCCGSSGNDGS